MNQETNIHTQTLINRSWNSAAGRIDYSFGFTFRTKEQYLAFRQLWKENYASLSGAIREGKDLVKATMRKREYAGGIQGRVGELKKEATLQLLMLKQAKGEANRQYLAARQTAQ